MRMRKVGGKAGVWMCALAVSAMLGASGGKDTMVAHFYYVDDNAAWESLSKNIGAVELLSPVWLHVGNNGEIRTAVDGRVKQLAARNGVALLPVVMNEDFRVEAARAALDEKRQDAVVAALVHIAKAEDFRGLQLDFENLEAADRDAYSRFAEKLGAALRTQKMNLSVAVAAPLFAPVPANVKAEAWVTAPRSEAFDYERLARAAEFITLMTYDQYTSPDAAGPVAGMGWMEACIRKMMEWAPAGKVMLGVPLYHRHWAGQQVTTGTWMEAQELSWRAKAGSVFDILHQEPVIRFREGSTGHAIWFHNAESVKRRIELAKRFRLRGISAWRMGQEDPSVWTEGLTGITAGERP